MGVGNQHHAPAALPPGKTLYPLYRRLGGPQGRSGRVRKISPPQGFDPRTVQPVASRYTDWAIPTPKRLIIDCIILIWELKVLGRGKYTDRICEWTGEIESIRPGSRCFVGCTGSCCSIDLPWTVHASPENRQHSLLQYQSIQYHRTLQSMN